MINQIVFQKLTRASLLLLAIVGTYVAHFSWGMSVLKIAVLIAVLFLFVVSLLFIVKSFQGYGTTFFGTRKSGESLLGAPLYRTSRLHEKLNLWLAAFGVSIPALLGLVGLLITK